MPRRYIIASGKAGPAFETDHESRARAKYLCARLLPGTTYAISDAGLYRSKSSADLRAAADRALEIELEASVALAELLKGDKC